MWAHRALHACLMLPDVHSVLDIGAGAELQHARLFAASGKQVTALEPYAEPRELPVGIRLATEIDQDARYDLVWASHVLEHVLDVHTTLSRWRAVCKQQGWICITVPPWKREVVGGHVNSFSAGTLLYNMVLAGIDCSQASVLTYGYNISVLTRNQRAEIPWDKLNYDHGDLETLAPFFPPTLRGQGFDGFITRHNWPD